MRRVCFSPSRQAEHVFAGFLGTVVLGRLLTIQSPWETEDGRGLIGARCLPHSVCRFFFFLARCSFPPLEPGAWAELRQQRHSRVRLSRQMHNMQMRHCWWAGLTTERAAALTLSSPRSSSVHTRAVYVNKTISCNCSCKRNSCLSYCVYTHTHTLRNELVCYWFSINR